MDTSALVALASAIQNQEGYAPGSLLYRNNNPGNLLFVGQPGATAGAGGFASFASYSDGFTALQAQISLDATRGTDAAGNPVTTVGDLITSWAPPSENDTAAYIASVTAQTGFQSSDSLLSLGSVDGGGDTADGGDVFQVGSISLGMPEIALGLGVAAVAYAVWRAF